MQQNPYDLSRNECVELKMKNKLELFTNLYVHSLKNSLEQYSKIIFQ